MPRQVSVGGESEGGTSGAKDSGGLAADMADDNEQ